MLKNPLTAVFLLVVCFPAFCGAGDKKIDFNKLYPAAMASVTADPALAKQYLQLLESAKKQFSPLQQAQISILRLAVLGADSAAVRALEHRMFEPPDSLAGYDRLVVSARKYLERSMPDKAISLLMDALALTNAGTDEHDFCRINLCEAYRQKQEYAKGIDILTEILYGGRSIADANRAFACNRLAAIYDEGGCAGGNAVDSVEKYSQLCIAIAARIHSTVDLALAQNELSFLYMRKDRLEEALALSMEAVKNFQTAGKVYSAMNALINQSHIYVRMKNYPRALSTVLGATELCPIEENRNLFMRLYLQISTIYSLMENYRDAFGFLALSRSMLNDFYRDRINTRILEVSAKYDLLTKEQNLREQRQVLEFQRTQQTFLLIILLVLCVAFALSILYLRAKRKEAIRRETIAAVVQTEEKERKRLASDLHDGLGPILSAINLYYQAYLDAPAEQKPEIETRLKNIIKSSIDNVSRIAHNISPHILERYGLKAALDNFIRHVHTGETPQFDFEFSGETTFGLKRELAVYRSITELINNSLKHAGASRIAIRISFDAEFLRIFYEDDGRGFDVKAVAAASEGMGLTNIQNRINSLDGSVHIRSAPSKGMRAEITVPLSPDHEKPDH